MTDIRRSKRIFLSMVSNEFRTYRVLLRKDLSLPDVEVKTQEDFIVTGHTTLEKLDVYTRRCDALIHIIGDATGALPSDMAVRVLLRKS
jgi:hypothetical protein